MPHATPNSDESLISTQDVNPEKPGEFAPFIGNFHKTLPHNSYGEVDAVAYRKFERTCMEIESGMPVNFEEVPRGFLESAAQSKFDCDALPMLTNDVARFTSPLAGAATESHGPDPKSMEMLPAPGCCSLTSAAEMVEIYWMALLRDAPLQAFQQSQNAGCQSHNTELGYDVGMRVNQASALVSDAFDCAIRFDHEPGKIRIPIDLSTTTFTPQTLFRSGLKDEEFGPLISQFFIRPIGYGTQLIDQQQVPYIAKQDFLTTHGDWLLAQNTGKDKFGRDYGNCNNYADQLHRNAKYFPVDQVNQPIKRYISTMRDLARFVNRDALHQAYFNAALFLDGLGAPLDEGNPYRGNRFSRENPFASLGGPDLLTLVSEVASRALKVVWRQKWLVHRRARPEVYGGLVQMQRNGYCGQLRHYGLPTENDECPQFKIALDTTLAEVSAHNFNLCGEKSYFLPMAFSAGSPTHPAYGAGHATVAGACVTVLKAWFDENAKLVDIFARAIDNASNKKNGPKDPSAVQLMLLQPGCRTVAGCLETFSLPEKYDGTDKQKISVGGELNKIASNVAMGRTMGGVHWRTDNTRSLRLGEDIAIEILRKRTAEYFERPVSFTFNAFDGHHVRISNGTVQKY